MPGPIVTDGLDDGPPAPPAPVALDPVTDGVAAFLNGELAKMAEGRRKSFPVPPWDRWGNRLVLVAKPFENKDGMTSLQIIVAATDHLIIDAGDGEPKEMGWEGIVERMGVDPEKVTLGQVIKKICDAEKSSDTIDQFASDLVLFSAGRKGVFEQALGE